MAAILAQSMTSLSLVFMILISLSLTSYGHPGLFPKWGEGGEYFGPVGGGGTAYGGSYDTLFPEYYQYSCPQANDIVVSVLKRAIAKEPRMAASLLRLQFHDCFSQVN